MPHITPVNLNFNIFHYKMFAKIQCTPTSQSNTNLSHGGLAFVFSTDNITLSSTDEAKSYLYVEYNPLNKLKGAIVAAKGHECVLVKTLRIYYCAVPVASTMQILRFCYNVIYGCTRILTSIYCLCYDISFQLVLLLCTSLKLYSLHSIDFYTNDISTKVKKEV